jgi:Ca2+-binding RTX toxin-like protein
MFLFGKAGRDVLRGGAGDDILYGFGGDDSLLGGAGHDVLAGHEGNDTLSGGTGDDYLLGGLGTDVIDGGAGVDWAAYEDATAAVKVSLALTGWQATGGAGSDKLTGIENLYGSAFNDTLIGNAGVNYLSGGAGDDRLEGGAGDDHLEGGLGNDTIIGGDGWDAVSYDDAPSARFVSLVGNIGNDVWGSPHSGVDVDQLESIEAVYGSRFGDYLQGNWYDNVLIGQDGNDTIEALDGDDYVEGGAGDDRIVSYYYENGFKNHDIIDGGEGFDTISFIDEGNELPVTIDLAANDEQVIGTMTSLTLRSIEGVVGSHGTDTFYASTARNVFQLDSQFTAADHVIFRNLAEIGIGSGADEIIGWAVVDVSRIDADTTKAGDQAFHVVSRLVSPNWPDTAPVPVYNNTSFTGNAGEIIQTTLSDGKNLVQFDVNGDKIADAELITSWTVWPGSFIL